MRTFWNRPLGSKLIFLFSLAMLALWVAAPWQRPCAAIPTGQKCGKVFAWEGHDTGKLIGAVALAMLIWELLPILMPRLSMRGWPTAVITTLLSFALVVVTLAKLIIDNEFQEIWAWVAFGLSLVILVTAIFRVRYRWDHRKREHLEAEVAAARAEAEAAKADAARAGVLDAPTDD